MRNSWKVMGSIMRFLWITFRQDEQQFLSLNSQRLQNKIPGTQYQVFKGKKPRISIFLCFLQISLLILLSQRICHQMRYQIVKPFPSSTNCHFQNEAKCKHFVVKMSFICVRIKTNFHINIFALYLAWKHTSGNLETVYLLHNITPSYRIKSPALTL